MVDPRGLQGGEKKFATVRERVQHIYGTASHMRRLIGAVRHR